MEAQLPGTRILLVDDHALFREGAARLLDAERDLKVVGRCGSVDEALEILGSTGVDLVLLDVDLGRERGFQFFKPARDNGFGGRVLVVAAVLSVFEARRLMQAGAAGVFLKQNPPNLLVDAIRSVMDGQLYIDSERSRAQTISGAIPIAVDHRIRGGLVCGKADVIQTDATKTHPSSDLHG